MCPYSVTQLRIRYNPLRVGRRQGSTPTQNPTHMGIAGTILRRGVQPLACVCALLRASAPGHLQQQLFTCCAVVGKQWHPNAYASPSSGSKPVTG